MESKLKVYTGNPNFNGRRYGVLFSKGVGEATEKQARVLVKNWGYKCPQLDAPKSEAVSPKPGAGMEADKKPAPVLETKKNELAKK